MGKQAPAPGDFTGAAQQQAASSQQAIGQQTQANRPNQTNAFGTSVNWTQGPNGQWQQTQSFGGGLGDAAQGLLGQAGQNLSNPFSFNGPAIGTGDDARNQAIQAAYGQATSRLDPQWQQREDAQRTQLLNQGLTPGTEAYNNAMANLGRERNDAYSSAMNGAIAQGTAAGNSVFQNNMAAHQQALADALRMRDLPMQELQGLQGFLGQQGFNAAGAADPTQYLSALMGQNNANMNAWNAQNQANADIWGGGMQLLGTAANFLPFKLSDERAKRDIRRLPIEAMPGVPFATWEYLGQPGMRHIGVIAQDLLPVSPRHVRERPDGLLEVDYSFLDGVR